jgi:hypothetical protein
MAGPSCHSDGHTRPIWYWESAPAGLGGLVPLVGPANPEPGRRLVTYGPPGSNSYAAPPRVRARRVRDAGMFLVLPPAEGEAHLRLGEAARGNFPEGLTPRTDL